MLLKLENICKSYNKNYVLNNINLEMSEGNIYGLVGRNGSGKTMIMKCICGLVIPDKGTLTIDGNVIGKNALFPKSIGVLIENPGFIEHYSAIDNLRELASINKISTEDDIKNLLEEVGLDYNDRKKVRKYSLGMRQKLGIAMAFLEEPDIIILDEPFNALDELTEKKVIKMIKKRRDNGKLIILSCHDSSLIEELADKIYYMKAGELI